MGTLTYGQTEEILASMTGIHPSRRPAFQSRLKQWQKMNFPEGVNVGRGVRAAYGGDQFYQLAFMIEVVRAGLPPERGVEAITSAWGLLKLGLMFSASHMADNQLEQRFSLIRIDAFDDLIHVDGEYRQGTTVTTVSRRDIEKYDGLKIDDFEESDRGPGLIKHLAAMATEEGALRTSSIMVNTSSLLVRSWKAIIELGLDYPQFDFCSSSTVVEMFREKRKRSKTLEAELAQRFLSEVHYEAIR